jgi:hypothetical protein
VIRTRRTGHKALNMNVLNYIYDASISRLFMIGLALAATHCVAPPMVLFLTHNLAVAFWAGIFSSVALFAFMVVTIRFHQERALWLLSIAPFGLVWPLLYAWFMYGCIVNHECELLP